MTTGSQGASLIAPHGGRLTQLIADDSRRRRLAKEAQTLPSWDLTPRQVCDIELLLNGGFSPLDGFMSRADYERVCAEMRLADGTLWPIPIPLDITEQFGEGLASGTRIALRHPEGIVLAAMTASDVWSPDRRAEAVSVFGTDDDFHPGVFTLLEQTNSVYVGGSIEGLELPPQHTFPALRRTPRELRDLFERRGWSDVVAFQTRNPMHPRTSS